MGFFDSVSSAFQDVAHNFGGLWNDVTGKSQQKSANQQNVKLQEMANEANVRLQKQQQDWEAMMANSAVSRRKDDLQNAGFNPLLAAGSAADVPNVAPAHVEAAHVGAVPSVARGVASAIEAYQTYGASKLMDAQARETNAKASVIENYGGAQASATLDLTKGQAQEITSRIENLAADTNVKSKETTRIQLENEIRGMDLESKSKLFQLSMENAKSLLERSKAENSAALAGQSTEWAKLAAFIGQFFTNINPFNSAGSAVGAGATVLRSIGD